MYFHLHTVSYTPYLHMSSHDYAVLLEDIAQRKTRGKHKQSPEAALLQHESWAAEDHAECSTIPTSWPRSVPATSKMSPSPLAQRVELHALPIDEPEWPPGHLDKRDKSDQRRLVRQVCTNFYQLSNPSPLVHQHPSQS